MKSEMVSITYELQTAWHAAALDYSKSLLSKSIEEAQSRSMIFMGSLYRSSISHQPSKTENFHLGPCHHGNGGQVGQNRV